MRTLIALILSTLCLTLANAADITFQPAGDSTAEPALMGNYLVRKAPLPEFTPTNVRDDGRFTYITLPKGLRDGLPAVFRLSADGAVEVVNSRWDGFNFRFVVDGLGEHFLLKPGSTSVIVDHQ